ncbi:unnamed protein product [Ectocarpus sp. 4 AP-2014]
MSAQGVAFLVNISTPSSRCPRRTVHPYREKNQRFESMVSGCKQDYVRRMADVLFRFSVDLVRDAGPVSRQHVRCRWGHSDGE